LVDLTKVSTEVLEAIVKSQLAAARALRQQNPADTRAALAEVLAALADFYLRDRRKRHGGLVLEKDPEREHRVYGDVSGTSSPDDAEAG